MAIQYLMVSFAKSAQAIASIITKLQIPAKTLVVRQAWPAGSWRTWAKLPTRRQLSENVQIIVAMNKKKLADDGRWCWLTSKQM